MMNGEFESTSNELTGKIYGQKARTVIDHLEARHRVHSPTMAMRASCARAACSARPVRGFSTASTGCCTQKLDGGVAKLAPSALFGKRSGEWIVVRRSASPPGLE